MCGSASIAAKPRHFKDLSVLRVSDLRIVICIQKTSKLKCFLPSSIPYEEFFGSRFKNKKKENKLQENFDKRDNLFCGKKCLSGTIFHAI
jgi:hypothetical protein